MITRENYYTGEVLKYFKSFNGGQGLDHWSPLQAKTLQGLC